MLARAGAGAARPAGLGLGSGLGSCRGATRDSRLCAELLSTSLAPLAGRTRRASLAPGPFSLSLPLSPRAERCSRSAGLAGPGGLRSPRAAPPLPQSSQPPGPRQSAGLPGMPPGPRVGAAPRRPAPPPPSPPLPHAARATGVAPDPGLRSRVSARPDPRSRHWRGGEQSWKVRGEGTQHPKTKHCQSEIKHAPSTPRGTKEINGETEAKTQKTNGVRAKHTDLVLTELSG